MKNLKYLVFIVVLLFISTYSVYADTCFYQSEEVSLEYEPSRNKFTIRQREVKTNIIADNEPLINKNNDKTDDAKFTGLLVKKITTECPNYIVYRRKERALWWASDGIWGFDNSSDASRFASASTQKKKMFTWQVPKSNVSRAEFEEGIKRNVATAINNANISYGVSGVTTSDKDMSCDELFDQSIMDLIKEILQYPRIIIPGIILVLGTIDFMKAVIAQKEEEMKKAQMTFIKRLLIGVAVYFVPVLINAIIWVANIAWKGLGYTTCNL